MRKRALYTLIMLGLVTSLLVGCAKDNTPAPFALTQKAPEHIQVHSIWNKRVGNGTDEQYWALGVRHKGQWLYTNDADGDVYALDAATGKVVWTTDVKQPLTNTVTVAEGQVFVAGLNGDLLALSQSSGKVLWHSPIPSLVLSPVSVSDNVVIAHVHNGDVVAFDAKTGKQLWLYNGTTPTISLMHSSQPVIVDGRVVVGFANGQLAVFALKTGNLLWQRPIALPEGSNPISNMVDVDSTPIVKAGVIYAVAYHANLVALTLRDGKLLWQRPVSSFKNLATTNGTIVVTDEQGRVLAFDQKTGQKVWVQQHLQHRSVSAPAVIDNRYVVVGDFEGYVHFLSATQGTLLARARIGSAPLRAQPLVMGLRVVVNTTAGTLALLAPGS